MGSLLRLTACQCVSLAFRAGGYSRQLAAFCGVLAEKAVPAITGESDGNQGPVRLGSVFRVTCTDWEKSVLAAGGYPLAPLTAQARMAKDWLFFPGNHKLGCPEQCALDF